MLLSFPAGLCFQSDILRWKKKHIGIPHETIDELIKHRLMCRYHIISGVSQQTHTHTGKCLC